MHPKLLELRPNRSLLNSDFDGYKLSLTQIHTISEQLKNPVDRLTPNLNLYSLLHAKLYALHNHLIGDNSDSECVYFIDKDLNILKYSIDSELNQFSNTALWRVPLNRERNPGDYNISLKFASKQIAVVADGLGYLYLLDRGSFTDNHQQWQVIFSGDVAGPDQNFIIHDAVYKSGEKPELHLLLLSIREKSERHSTILHWITLQNTDNWNQIALRELTIKGFVQYAQLEPDCEAIYVVSDSGCKFTLDSEKEIKTNPEDTIIEKKYTWSQSPDDITIKFPLPRFASKHFLEIKTQNNQIQVKYEQGILLQGPLHQSIDSELTTWTITNNNLEIILQKSQTGQLWNEIVEGDLSGDHIPDPGLVEEITERLAPLTSTTESVPQSGTTFNSQQVEECDFESDKLTVFERLSCNSHNVTHRVNLGSHQVLLTVNFDKKLSLALGIRSDVDTCLWQPKLESNDNFYMEHIGTLLAMGYIQASKQQMKFFVCSPDLSYSVICEGTKHIFIYLQNKTLSSTNELRNRSTGRRVLTIAQQQVINLPSNDEILGCYASNSYLYVLGETFITALKL